MDIPECHWGISQREMDLALPVDTPWASITDSSTDKAPHSENRCKKPNELIVDQKSFGGKRKLPLSDQGARRPEGEVPDQDREPHVVLICFDGGSQPINSGIVETY